MISQADLGMLDGLERALLNSRLRMVYQPKVSLSDGRLRRVEALVRWDDPELGAVSPSRFVPLAEKHGLIDELTQWGLRTTLRQWLSWREQGLDTCLAVMQVLYDGLADSKYRPCPLLVKYVEAGWLGRKSGRGFYDYSGEKPIPTR